MKISNIKYKHDSNNEDYLFNGLNWNINDSEKVVLMGQSSGAGKGTLMKFMINLHPIESGSIDPHTLHGTTYIYDIRTYGCWIEHRGIYSLKREAHKDFSLTDYLNFMQILHRDNLLELDFS